MLAARKEKGNPRSGIADLHCSALLRPIALARPRRPLVTGLLHREPPNVGMAALRLLLLLECWADAAPRPPFKACILLVMCW
jgi:hypothetical protein